MSTTDTCLNCNHRLDKEAHYCDRCGQKAHDGKAPLFQITKEFFSEQLNIDGRLWSSIRSFLHPGQLTQDYFAGKRTSHLNPYRLLFFVAVVTLALFRFSNFENGIVQMSSEGVESANPFWFANQQQFLTTLDSLEIELDRSLPLATDQTTKDSILQHLRASFNLASDSVDLNQDLVILWIEGPMVVSVRDFNSMTPSQLMDHYPIKGLLIRMVTRQKIKFYKDPSALAGYFLGNFVWILLAYIPIIALVLKMLYFRRKRYFVEHLVFSLHLHTAFLLGFALVTLGTLLVGGTSGWQISLPILFSIYLLFAQKRYYQQPWKITILKFVLLQFTYPIIFAFFLLFVSVINFLLF